MEPDARPLERFGEAAVDGVLRALLTGCAERHITHHDLGWAFATLGDPPFVASLWACWVVPPGDADVVATCETLPGRPPLR